eukprot:IDg3766t1
MCGFHVHHSGMAFMQANRLMAMRFSINAIKDSIEVGQNKKGATGNEDYYNAAKHLIVGYQMGDFDSNSFLTDLHLNSHPGPKRHRKKIIRTAMQHSERHQPVSQPKHVAASRKCHFSRIESPKRD